MWEISPMQVDYVRRANIIQTVLAGKVFRCSSGKAGAR